MDFTGFIAFNPAFTRILNVWLGLIVFFYVIYVFTLILTYSPHFLYFYFVHFIVSCILLSIFTILASFAQSFYNIYIVFIYFNRLQVCFDCTSTFDTFMNLNHSCACQEIVQEASRDDILKTLDHTLGEIDSNPIGGIALSFTLWWREL